MSFSQSKSHPLKLRFFLCQKNIVGLESKQGENINCPYDAQVRHAHRLLLEREEEGDDTESQESAQSMASMLKYEQIPNCAVELWE